MAMELVNAFILLFLVTSSYASKSSPTLTLTSSWSDSIVCEGYDVEMTCVIQKTSGIDNNLTVSIIRNRSAGRQSSYCSVWPLPNHGRASCSKDRHGDIPGIGVNGSKINDVTLILLVVIERVLPQDNGTYECGVGDHGEIRRLAEATLNLKVGQRRSDCSMQVDTLSRKLYIDLAEGVVGSPSLVCVHGSVPPVSTVWLRNGTNLPSSVEVSSGIFTASLLRTRNDSEEDHDVYQCSVKMEESYVILHRFERPDIRFYVTDKTVTEEILQVSINVYITSGIDLRSPLSCNFSVRPFNHRYYGARAANFKFSIALAEVSYFFLVCKASNKLGRTIKSYNYSSSPDSRNYRLSMTTLAPGYSGQTSVRTFVSEMSSSFNSKAFSSLLPEFLRTKEAIILFSILILLCIVVIATLIFCVCKLSNAYKHRRIHRHRIADGYWSRVSNDGDERGFSIANRALPSIPEDIYNPCGSSNNGSVPTLNPVAVANRPSRRVDVNTLSVESTRIGGTRKKHTKCRSCHCKKRHKGKHPRIPSRVSSENDVIEQTYFMEENKKSNCDNEYLEPIEDLLDVDRITTHIYSSTIDKSVGDKLHRFNSLPNLQSFITTRNRTVSF